MSADRKKNRTKNYTGVVHYADTFGRPACGTPVSGGWNRPSVATVTCKKCEAQVGLDDPGHTDPEPVYGDEHAQRRAAERAVRQAARFA
jgi:hypothetical protein